MLLGAVAVVRDDLDVLGAALADLRDHVDAVTLVDAGGAEGTLEAFAADTLGALPHAVLPSGPLEGRRGPRTRFTLWIEPDERLEGGAALRAALDGAPVGGDDSSSARVPSTALEVALEIRGVARTRELRVFRGSADTVAAVVERRRRDGERTPGAEGLAGVAIVEPPAEDAATATRRERRWRRDVSRLERAVRDDPHDADAASQLGVLYLRLGHGELALGALDRLARLTGPAGRFDVRLLQARAAGLARATRWHELLERYLLLHAEWPARPEPLFDLAVRCEREGADGPAALFGERALALHEALGERSRLEAGEVEQLRAALARAAARLGA